LILSTGSEATAGAGMTPAVQTNVLAGIGSPAESLTNQSSYPLTRALSRSSTPRERSFSCA
jgi:hypothetical protein